jgi:hypothetical protein
MSIDREINARVDAYGNNPQALQKKYSMSKDLVDLLALQKIKKSMDEERNSIAMAMQSNPATIKQQREQEIFGRTAEDVAQQLGGILQTAKNKKQMARRPAPQGLGALVPQQRQRPQQGQRPQQPQTRMMQAGGIVAFQDGGPTSLGDLPDKGVNQGQLRDVARAQITQLLEGGMSPQAIKQELPPQYVGLVDEVVQTRRATAPPGMMEEVVVTAPRLPQAPAVNPLTAEGMMREQGKTKQTKDKNITEIPAPKDITPAKPAPKKGAPQFTEVDGIRRQLNPDGSLVVMPAADTAPTMLEYARQGTLDNIRDKYLSGIPLSQNEMKMYDEYGPGMESLEGQFGSGKASGIAAVAGETTGTAQVQPSRAEGIQAIAESTIPTAENALVLRDQGNNYQEKKDTPKPPPTGTAPSSTPQGFDLETALKEIGDAPAPVKVDREGLEKRGQDLLKTYGVDPASIDPEEAGIEALTKAGGFYGIKQKDAELRKGLADLAAIDAAQTDPDRLRRDRLIAFLTGGAGRGNTALAAAGAASANLGARQDRDIRERQVKRNEMLKDIQNQDIEIRKLAKGEERAAIERADNLKMEGLRIISTMSNAELSARQTEANAINETNIANYKGKMERVGLLLEQSNAAIDQAIERAKLASLDADRRADIANAGIDDAMRRKTEIAKLIQQTYNDQLAADPTLMSLRNRMASSDLSDEEANEINAAIQNRMAQIYANLAFAQKDDIEELDQLDKKILELETTRNSILGGGVADIPVSPEVEDAIARNQNR